MSYFLLSFAAIIVASLFQGCGAMDGSDCVEYQKLEQQVHCGANGYLIGYGYKYCTRFFEPEYYDEYDAAGKKFVQCTGECLIQGTDNIVASEEAANAVNCTDIINSAFGIHEKCYLQCNFCQICKTNKMALLHTYDVTDFFSARAIKQVYDVIRECGVLDCLW